MYQNDSLAVGQLHTTMEVLSLPLHPLRRRQRVYLLTGLQLMTLLGLCTHWISTSYVVQMNMWDHRAFLWTLKRKSKIQRGIGSHSQTYSILHTNSSIQKWDVTCPVVTQPVPTYDKSIRESVPGLLCDIPQLERGKDGLWLLRSC